MKKMRMSSPYITDQNIAKIGELFPNVLTETHDEQGELKQAIDFELLKQELSEVIVEGDKERYQLTWPGKKEAILNANSPINETLRPVKEDSVDWDTTQNLYIEGDNLEVMKLLQESYLNKVKCIYIDPPYNTGNDFVYKDDYKQTEQKYLERSGQVNDAKAIMFQNTESNGRFHSDWLKMLYERLKVSRNLLSEDGVIFISIDDNELSNMQKICDEIFGVQTFIGNFVWKRRASSAMASNLVSTDHEYILCYGKNSGIIFKGLSKNYINYKNPDNDPRGDWTTGDLTVGMNKDQRPNQYYELIDPLTGKIYKPNPNRVWAFIPESMNKLLEEQRIVFPEDEEKRPMLKRFKDDLRKEVDPISTFLLDVGMNSEGTRVIKEHFNIPIFNYSKPITLVKKLIQQVAKESDIVLDFFSGSATTAEVIMELNSLDRTQLKFIMIQIQEDIKENAEAQNLGLTNICEIGKERIRRAANKIKQDTNADIDYGFRVYKVASSNMKDIYYTPDKLGQLDLLDLQSNIKEDRSAEDLLIQVMLELGLELSLPMSSKHIDECIIYDVDNHKLTACFEENISESIMKQMAAMKPEYAVFRDHSFQDDSARINVHELFKLLSPNTDVRVL